MIRIAAGFSLFFLTFAPAEDALRVKTFETVWQTVRDKHWDPAQLEDPKTGLSWQKLHDEYLPKIRQCRTDEEARQLMRQMIGRLRLSHFQIIGSDVYKDLDETGGPPGEGRTGIEVAVIAGQAVVRSVEPGSPAEARGVKPGWRIVKIRGREVDPVLAKLAADREHPLRVPSAQRGFLLSRLSGPVGMTVPIEFDKGTGQRVTLEVGRIEPRGGLTKFGFLPPIPVWTEFEMVDGARGKVGIFRFNMFLDPPRLVAEFSKAVDSCQQCAGFIIDIRGNPGGIGALAMGLGGFFIDKPNLKLGKMVRRDMTLNFALNPRQPSFKGPLAILIDGSSGSTSEIFAGGMKDVKRARIFGSKSMGAALPSVVERLPNGDGFQYAVANYISASGLTLEGNGVTPDEPVALTREALLTGGDPVSGAALKWINAQKTVR